MLKKDLKEIIEYQKNIPLKKNLIKRETKINLKTSQIIIISGIRRCGKSTLLYQSTKNHSYLNFEDPRLQKFEVSDFIKVEEIFEAEKTKYYFFDEIQNIPEWERYARLAQDRGKKLLITGSNANMLSRELGTRLTGRYNLIELFPFSYNEYLIFTHQTANSKSLMKYLKDGGFPEYLKEKNNSYLQLLYSDILTKDIIVRKGIRNEETIFNLANFLISNVGKIFSYNKLSKTLGIKSVRTVIDYCKFISESYLIELVPNYSPSINKQIKSNKKVYVIDTGLINANTLSFSKDIGRILENAVYLNLRRKNKKIFYFKEDNECDFLIKKQNQITQTIQVCYEVNEKNLKREINGLKEAMKYTKCKKGVIITFDQEDTIEGIKLIPAWKYFLE